MKDETESRRGVWWYSPRRALARLRPRRYPHRPGRRSTSHQHRRGEVEAALGNAGEKSKELAASVERSTEEAAITASVKPPGKIRSCPRSRSTSTPPQRGDFERQAPNPKAATRAAHRHRHHGVTEVRTT